MLHDGAGATSGSDGAVQPAGAPIAGCARGVRCTRLSFCALVAAQEPSLWSVFGRLEQFPFGLRNLRLGSDLKSTNHPIRARVRGAFDASALQLARKLS
jgi:hypothetical protein